MYSKKFSEKPAEHGMKTEIEKMQQNTVEGVFKELKEKVKNPNWDKDPREFFKLLGEKLKEASINEKSFADFIMKETKKSFKLTFRATNVWMESLTIHNFPIKVDETHPAGKGETLLKNETRLAKELVAIAECMKEAVLLGGSLSEYFGKVSNDYAKKLVSNNREIMGEWYTSDWKDQEREKAYFGKNIN